MAIENVKNKTVVVYTWLSNGVKNVEILLSQVFLHSTCSSKMVGSTIESKFIGNMSVLYFAGKKASYIRHCKKKSLCIVPHYLKYIFVMNKRVELYVSFIIVSL